MAQQNSFSTIAESRPEAAFPNASVARFFVDYSSFYAFSFYCYFSSFSYGSWESGSGRSSRQAM